MRWAVGLAATLRRQRLQRLKLQARIAGAVRETLGQELAASASSDSSCASDSASGASVPSAQAPTLAPTLGPTLGEPRGLASGPAQFSTAPSPYIPAQPLPSTAAPAARSVAFQAAASSQGIQPLPPLPAFPDLPEAPVPPVPPAPPAVPAGFHRPSRGLSRARIAEGVSEELRRQLGTQRRDAESQTLAHAPEGWEWPVNLFRSGTAPNGKVHIFRDCQGLANSRQVVGTGFCVFCATRVSYGGFERRGGPSSDGGVGFS